LASIHSPFVHFRDWQPADEMGAHRARVIWTHRYPRLGEVVGLLDFQKPLGGRAKTSSSVDRKLRIYCSFTRHDAGNAVLIGS